MTQQHLKARWITLFPQASLSRCLEAWNYIEQRYAEPHRHFHTLRHIETLLKLRDEYFPAAERKIELAIWLHDLIYVPGDRRNEVNSSHLAAFWLSYLDEDQTTVHWVRRCVAASDLHQGFDGPSGIVYDLDLLSLASEPD